MASNRTCESNCACGDWCVLPEYHGEPCGCVECSNVEPSATYVRARVIAEVQAALGIGEGLAEAEMRRRWEHTALARGYR